MRGKKRNWKNARRTKGKEEDDDATNERWKWKCGRDDLKTEIAKRKKKKENCKM